MSLLGKKPPVIIQDEATECGLCCLAMIAATHGYHTDLPSLRRAFPISLKGVTLTQIIRIAKRLDLDTRPLKLDLEGLAYLRLPCIIHWEFDHFVVLVKVTSNHITIHDPAVGIRRISIKNASMYFTGVALELWPTSDFKPSNEKKTVSLGTLIGKVIGLRRSLTQLFLIAFAIEIFSLAAPFYMQIVVDQGLSAADQGLLLTLAWCFALFIFLQHGLVALRSRMILYISTSLNVQWRSSLFSHLLKLPLSFFQKRHLGDIVSRFGSVDAIQRTLSTSFIEAVMDGIMGILTLTMLFLYSTKLATIPFISTIVYLSIRSLWYGSLKLATEEQLLHGAKQHSHFIETLRGIRVIRDFERVDQRSSAWMALVVNQLNSHITGEKLKISYQLTNRWLFGLERILLIYIASSLVLDSQMTVGIMLAFLAYREQFNNRITGLIDKYFEMKMLKVQLHRVSDIALSKVDLEQEYSNPAELTDYTLELKNIQFRYSRFDESVLKGVNLKIQPGESIAIIGKTGCGKSTLLEILMGSVKPVSGEIVIGGKNIDTLGVSNYRQFIASVLQDDILFAGSIANNISCFESQPDFSWIEECAATAAIHEEIKKMPMGYNTLVGEMGGALSGGQKQRILIARALYKKPKILFLDEASSHLDIYSEQKVNEAIARLEITRIIVAHRPQTISSAERVVELRDGSLEEISFP
jgi:ATP-binding cassette subfamily B protein RaxB